MAEEYDDNSSSSSSSSSSQSEEFEFGGDRLSAEMSKLNELQCLVNNVVLADAVQRQNESERMKN